MRRKSSLQEQSPSYSSLEDIGRLSTTSTIKQAFVILTFFFFISLLISLYGDSKNANSAKNGLYSWLSAKFRTKAENNNSFEVSHRKSTEISFFLEPYEVYRPNNFYNDFQEQFSLIFSPDIHAAKEPDYNTLNEALNTLGAAEQSSVKGDEKKAEKLYSHAIALQPKHPKILVQYGLFIEKVKSDVLAASTFYTKAIILCPDDSNAKKHFARTLPLVEEIDSQMLRKLDQKRERFIHIPRSSLALRRLMRESYVEYIYHTVAMEGNTMNLAQTRSILETHMVVNGKSIMEHNEILGMDAALRFINSTLIHKNRPISIQDILEIHKRVFGFVDPLEAGTFRRTQVFVGGFVPCDPEEIQREMDEFIDWLSLESTQRIHPVELAALVHYKFIIIHPFIDGNGRTARILMNLILMRAGFPPVIVNVAERSGYYETLKIANDGDLRPFIRFIASCTDRTLETYLTYTTEISPIQNDHKKIVIEGSLDRQVEDNRHIRS